MWGAGGWLAVRLPTWGSSEQTSDEFRVEIGGGHTQVFLSWKGRSEGPKVPALEGMAGGGIAVGLYVGIRDEREVTSVAVVPTCIDELGAG